MSVKANVMLVNMPTPSEPNASPNQPLAASGKESYHHGDLKRALIAAATVLIETGGSKALTLRAAATAAGVSIAAVGESLKRIHGHYILKGKARKRRIGSA